MHIEVRKAIYAAIGIHNMLIMHVNREGAASKLMKDITMRGGTMLDTLSLFFQNFNSIRLTKCSLHTCSERLWC